ncbi:MAG: ankyrin repeat domain-containing protein, partial [Silicimonas sp.]|nr:ankyrin repeat domain-containing protein [Silicimonas sp.]
EAYRDIVRVILHLPGKLDHVKRLVAMGVEYDRPDAEGLTPVQVAGWEGLPEVMAYFLSQKPDLSHVNGYGGTLLSTIIHGSENCPERAGRDHIGCLELALRAGVALPRRVPGLAGDPEVAAFLTDWAEQYPGQVVDGGVA